jgi:hypothetical protein
MMLLNMVRVQNFEVMLAQMLNHSVEFCNFVQCYVLAKYLTLARNEVS